MNIKLIEYLVRTIQKGETNAIGGEEHPPNEPGDRGARPLSLEEMKVLFLGQIAINTGKLLEHFETVDAVVFGSPQAKGKPSGKVR